MPKTTSGKPIQRTISREGQILNCPSIKNTNEFVTKISIMTPIRYERKEEAWFLLHKIAALVQPIMKSHGFRIFHLSEFDKPNLLGTNYNRGQKVCIRLRRFNNINEFLPLNSLLGTMIHELTHNKYGPHNDLFNNYMNQMIRELEDLMAQGFSGGGFFCPGSRLGIKPRNTYGLPFARVRYTGDTPESAFQTPGRRLGGDLTTTAQPPKKLRNNENDMKNAILKALEKRLPKAVSQQPTSVINGSNSSNSSNSSGTSRACNSINKYLSNEDDENLMVIESRASDGKYAKFKIEPIEDTGDEELIITGQVTREVIDLTLDD